MEKEELIKIYIDLWKSENTVKTAKLMAYLAAQPLVAIGFSKSTPASIFFAAIGMVLSFWWFFLAFLAAGRFGTSMSAHHIVGLKVVPRISCRCLLVKPLPLYTSLP